MCTMCTWIATITGLFKRQPSKNWKSNFYRSPYSFPVVIPHWVMSTICCVHRVFMSLSDLQAISALDLKEKALTAFSLCWFFTLQHLKAFCCRDNSRTDMALPDTRSSSRGIPSVATRFPLLRSYLCQVLDQVEQAESVSILFWLSASFKWEESA